MSSLLAHLVDDAAVFPPGDAVVPDAVRIHRELRHSRYAPALGPMLIRATQTAELVGQVRSGDDLKIGLIASPEGGLVELAYARDLLLDLEEAATLIQIEIALPQDHDPGAAAEAMLEGLAFSAQAYLEIPRRSGWESALDVLAGDGVERAKFRTGGVTADAHPSEDELAAFICACVERALAFKLTAGLHHAVRHTTELGFEQHGVLNVLAGVSAAQDGASRPEIADVLAARRPEPLLERLADSDHRRIRESWVSFGCCGVTEPLDELAALGLDYEEDA